MSTRLVDAASRALGDRTSRRGFLRRMAIAGSALVTAPMTYALRPMNAYQVLTSPGDCRGGRCTEGWTEFCCTLTGVNTCPPGSVVAGWWRAEGSGYCGGTSRYYMDCHNASCGGCGCGGSGTCGNECVNCACHCAHDRCDLWKTCCTRFRYGQCNQHLACVGPIVCRVVTCVPPWEWDSTCTPVDARDDFTSRHDAPCLHPPVAPYYARPGVVRDAQFLLRGSLSAGPVEQSFTLGAPGDHPLMGDWTGAGVATAGVVRGVRHGRIGEETLTWFLRQEEGAGQPDLVIEYGQPGDIPVVGDWTGNGVDTIGVVRGNHWLLRTRNAPGPADIVFSFGDPGGVPVVGDWDGDGRDGVGMVTGPTWTLRDTPTPGPPSRNFDFGSDVGVPVVGDWDGDGIAGPGRFRDGEWSLGDATDGSGPTRTFLFGGAGDIPVVWRRLPHPGA